MYNSQANKKGVEERIFLKESMQKMARNDRKEKNTEHVRQIEGI